jgi:hypothetical protein
MSEDRGSSGLVQDAPPASSQRNDSRLRAALDEFENVLKIALDDLFDAVSDVLPHRYVELSDGDEDEDPPGGEITVKGFIVDDAQETLSEAFSALDWPLQRALRQLREALR